jgi:hypothetical protein
MCGIVGFIGQSKDPAASYELATQLFLKTESRGIDATGIWGTEPGNKRIIYHKEPIKVSEFIIGDMWKKIKNINPDLLLMHTRAASYGVGSPKINKNNHPFVSKDFTTALIHNGRIPDVEYGQLKKQYDVESDCDSEMFLRVFEHGKEPIDGIKDIWTYMHRSHMAVAIGEHLGQDRRLWLFRNTHRPLWLTDMRDTLGQIFFFSHPDIWDEATGACESVWDYIGKVKLYNLTTEMVWCFDLNAAGKIDLHKFKICIKDNVPWQTKEKMKIKESDSNVEVITGLDEDEEVLNAKKPVIVTPPSNSLYNGSSLYGGLHNNLFIDTSDNKKNLEELEVQIKEVEVLLANIKTTAENLAWEGTMDSQDFTEIFSSLETVSTELQGTMRLLDANRH